MTLFLSGYPYFYRIFMKIKNFTKTGIFLLTPWGGQNTILKWRIGRKRKQLVKHPSPVVSPWVGFFEVSRRSIRTEKEITCLSVSVYSLYVCAVCLFVISVPLFAEDQAVPLDAAGLTVTESEKAEFLKLATKYNPKTISVGKPFSIRPKSISSTFTTMPASAPRLPIRTVL